VSSALSRPRPEDVQRAALGSSDCDRRGTFHRRVLLCERLDSHMLGLANTVHTLSCYPHVRAHPAKEPCTPDKVGPVGGNQTREVKQGIFFRVGTHSSGRGRSPVVPRAGSFPCLKYQNTPPSRPSLDFSSSQQLGHTAAVYVAKFSPRDSLVASAGFDRTLRLWEGAYPYSPCLEGHRQLISDLCWAPDGRSLLSASFDQVMF